MGIAQIVLLQACVNVNGRAEHTPKVWTAAYWGKLLTSYSHIQLAPNVLQFAALRSDALRTAMFYLPDKSC